MHEPPESLLDAPLRCTGVTLLERIAVARAWLDAIVSGETDDAFADRHDAAGWRPLDHLLHVAAWERMIVAHLASGDEHEIAGVARARFDAMPLAELNDVLFLRTRALARDAALGEYRAAHDAIIAHLRGMPDAAFAAPYWPDEPAGRTAMEKVAGDTYRHYLEHGGWIREMLDDAR